MTDPTLYRVGAPYSPGHRSWPEGTDYNYRSGAHELRLFWRSPISREVRAVKSGPAEFGLVVHPPAIYLLYRFGDMPWSDQPFTIHLVPAAERAVPPPAEVSEPHALLTTFLVDASTGLIRVIRVTTWSPAFTAAIHLAIRDQFEAGWPGDTAYNAAVLALQTRYPTSESLLATAIARTEGGR